MMIELSILLSYLAVFVGVRYWISSKKTAKLLLSAPINVSGHPYRQPPTEDAVKRDGLTEWENILTTDITQLTTMSTEFKSRTAGIASRLEPHTTFAEARQAEIDQELLYERQPWRSRVAGNRNRRPFPRPPRVCPPPVSIKE